MTTCTYSFQDLFDAANIKIEPETFYSLPRQTINRYVKLLCAETGWEWEDRIGLDGVVYTAFAPLIKLKINAAGL